MKRDRSSAVAFLAVTFVFLPFGLSACEDVVQKAPDPLPTSATVLLPRDSVRLHESDSLYIGNAFDLMVDTEDGRFYVSDVFLDRVLSFSRVGHPLRSYARPGEGPGELINAGPIYQLGPSRIAVSDGGRDLIEFFDKASGQYQMAIRYSGTAGMSSLGMDGDSVVFLPIRSSAEAMSIARWSRIRDTVEYVVPLPEPYQRSLRSNGAFAGFYSRSTLIWDGEHVIVGLTGHNDLLVADRFGHVTDTIRVPRLYRRGVPAGTEDIFESTDYSFANLMAAASVLLRIDLLPAGRILAIHSDGSVEGEPPASITTATLYATIIDRKNNTACVDLLIPNLSVERPVVASRGDTVFVLERRVLPDATLQTWIFSYPIDFASCEVQSMAME